MALTPKQQRFCEEYLCDLNATQAAIRAGYSPATANEQGSQLLVNLSIQQEVARMKADRSERTQITADMVLRELAKVGFSDMRRFSAWGPDGVFLKESSELSDDDAACIAEVSQTISKDGGSLKFKLHDKPGALTQIGRHLGMFTDKVDVNLKDPVKVLVVDPATYEAI